MGLLEGNLLSNFGAIAQLVEHIPFKDGVDGSSPSRATNFLPLARSKTEDDCLGSPSSSGLGHYPFTVDTPVQIRLGTPIFVLLHFNKSRILTLNGGTSSFVGTFA
jgi:hypothetical protein